MVVILVNAFNLKKKTLNLNEFVRLAEMKDGFMSPFLFSNLIFPSMFSHNFLFNYFRPVMLPFKQTSTHKAPTEH